MADIIALFFILAAFAVVGATVAAVARV